MNPVLGYPARPLFLPSLVVARKRSRAWDHQDHKHFDFADFARLMGHEGIKHPEIGGSLLVDQVIIDLAAQNWIRSQR